jgi:hypothetical protein
MSKKRNFL